MLQEIENSANFFESYVPRNPLERFIVRRALDIQKYLRPKALQEIRKAAKEVAEFVAGFDVILVAGHSGVIAATLLKMNGDDASKIIEITPHQNDYIFKNASPYQVSQNIVNFLSNIIRNSTVNTKSLLSCCLVEDRIRSGGKFTHYFKLLSQVAELGKVAVAAYASEEDLII